MQSSLTKQPGTVIDDRYEIESLLGVGGMSSVYRVLDRNMNRVVALKMLHPHITEHRGSAERFLQEAKAEGLIRHPNVIGVHAVSVTRPDGFLYIVMDYLQGESLAEVIKDGPLKDQNKALDLFLQTCRGLQAAHEKGVVHRDLKPSNVMLVDHGRTVKLVDFGIARLYTAHNNEQRLTKEGAVLGSPEYMSPEQCEGHNVDARSDIYSMGCLMYEMLTGHVPFDGDNQIEILCKHVAQVPPPVSDSAPWVADGFDQIIAKCLEKDPGKRYQKIENLIVDLEGIDAAAPVQMRATTSKSQSPKIRALPRWAIATFGSVALAAIIIAFVPSENQDVERIPAQTPPAKNVPSDPAEALKVLIKEANQLYADGKHAEAIAKYDLVLIGFQRYPTLLQNEDLTQQLPLVGARASESGLSTSLEIAQKLFETNKIFAARALAQASAKSAEQYQDSVLEGNFYVLLAYIDVAIAENGLVPVEMDKALDAFNRQPDLDEPTYTRLFKMITLLNGQHQLRSSAAHVGERVYSMALARGDRAHAQQAAYSVGLCYSMRQDFEQAAKWYQKCLAFLKDRPENSREVYQTHCELGVVLQGMGKQREAKRYYDKCRPYIEKEALESPSNANDFKLDWMAKLYENLGENQIAAKLNSLRTH